MARSPIPSLPDRLGGRSPHRHAHLGSLTESRSAFEVALRIGSRTTMLVYTIMVFSPDEHVVLETSGSWYRGRDDVRIRPSATGGSEVRWDAVFALRGPLVILEPLLRIGFRRTARKAVDGLEAALTALRTEEE